MEVKIVEVKQLLLVPKEIVVISHRNPDGDAIGSSLAMLGYLNKYYHKVTVIFPSEYPATFLFLDKIQQSLIFDLNHDSCRLAIEKADLIFCLDFNGLDRVDKLGESIQFSKAKKILIDHHLDPEPFSDFEFSDSSASSTAELVYLFIKQMGDLEKIDIKIGEAIFTGLITDTGSFKYNTRPETFRVAASLKEIGVDDFALQDKIFNSLKIKHLKILGHCLANRMEVIEDYGVGIVYLNKQDYIDFNIQRGDTEGIVNQLLYVKDIQVAAFISEQPTIVKISLRSKNDISVQEIATKYFNGGGHKNASGGGVYASLTDIIEKLKRVIPLHVPKIVNQ